MAKLQSNILVAQAALSSSTSSGATIYSAKMTLMQNTLMLAKQLEATSHKKTLLKFSHDRDPNKSLALALKAALPKDADGLLVNLQQYLQEKRELQKESNVHYRKFLNWLDLDVLNEKIKVTENLIHSLEGKSTPQFSNLELAAAQDGRLRKILQDHKSVLPKAYNDAVEANDNRFAKIERDLGIYKP